jgi:phage antirepressor YoqD-like protein
MTTTLAFPDDESPFDSIREVDEHGNDSWSARTLQPFLGYDQWRRFAEAIDQAKAVIEAEHGADAAESQIAATGKITKNARGQSRTLPDFRLSRYAAYLTAMRGDSRKPEIRAALVYFAVKTREAEIAQQRPALPQDYEQALVALLSEVRERKALEGKVAELEPMAEQARHFRAADGMIAIPDFANDLKAWAKQQHDVVVHHVEVWDFLGEIHLIIRGNTIRRNRATAFATDNDYVREKKTTFHTNTRGEQASWTSRLTTAGAGYAWDKAVVRITENQALRRSDAA